METNYYIEEEKNTYTIMLSDCQIESLLLINSSIQEAINVIFTAFVEKYSNRLTSVDCNPTIEEVENQVNIHTITLTDSQIDLLRNISTSTFQKRIDFILQCYEEDNPTILSVSAMNFTIPQVKVVTPLQVYYSDYRMKSLESLLIYNEIPYKTVFENDDDTYTLMQMLNMYEDFRDDYLKSRKGKYPLYTIERYECLKGKKYYLRFDFKSKKIKLSSNGSKEWNDFDCNNDK